MSHEIAIGVDAGGTKTVARIVVDGAPTAFLRVAGPAQPRRDGVDAAADVIAGVVGELLDRSGAQPGFVACGVAGTRDEERRAAFTAALTARLGFPVHVVTDVLAALLATSERGPAAVLIAGTGSIAALRDAGGVMQRAGGLGLETGDPGSGPWIASRCPELGDGAAVDRAAMAGDPAALAALGAAIHVLTELVESLLPPEFSGPLGMVGGVLEGSAIVRDGVVEALNRTRPGAVAGFPAVPPEVGAVRARKSR